MKIVVYNLGCKVNQYECDSLTRRLRAQGHDVSERLEDADLYVLNTCAVTNEAERKSRQCVERCLRLRRDASVVVMGCASQNDPTQFASKRGVTLVKGIAHKMGVADDLTRCGIELDELPAVYEDDFCAQATRTRAYVKVQDGCDRFCTYCLIPYLRGRSRSRAIDSVVRECEALARTCKEIVLTGIDLSSYGKRDGATLTQLLAALRDVPCRIRLGSLEVSAIDDGLLQASETLQAFCPQFHLSMQSGDDETLRAMNRRYTTAQYADKVALIRRYYPTAGITTDWICGFPTETEAQFRASEAFVRAIGFSQIHVFGYSPRKGTVADRRYAPLAGDVVKDRCDRAAAIAAQSKAEYLARAVGTATQVLTEELSDGYVFGYNPQYARVALPPDTPCDRIVNARVLRTDGTHLFAEPADKID